MGHACISVASTGIAASLMDKGQTVHTRFKIPVPCDSESSSRIKPFTSEAGEILAAKLIIWDEATMSTKEVVDCVDRLLRQLTNNQITMFGGKVVIFAGDFRQTLPVVPSSSPAFIVSKCMKFSALWPNLLKFKLNINMRTRPTEIEFANWLLELGEGRVPTIDNNYLIQLPAVTVLDTNENLVNSVFGAGILGVDHFRNSNAAILTPLNQHALEINEVVLNRLDGKLIIIKNFI